MSKRNEELRKDLKRINEELGSEIKKKKFVPKKKKTEIDEDEIKAHQRQNGTNFIILSWSEAGTLKWIQTNRNVQKNH